MSFKRCSKIEKLINRIFKYLLILITLNPNNLILFVMRALAMLKIAKMFYNMLFD